jgi:hypothetical protein
MSILSKSSASAGLLSSFLSVGDSASLSAAKEIAFESFGARVGVRADSPEVLERIPALLPPYSQPCPSSAAEGWYSVLARPDGSYDFLIDGSPVTAGIDLGFAITLLEAQLRIFVGLHAPHRIFVHAGVVAHEGRAVVIPGRSFAGKTTLVLALVRAGALYYSDEFAILDEEGLVHPYAKPVSVRDENHKQNDHDIERLGGIAGDEPLRIGAVVFTEYRPGAEWNPTELSPGRGALAMFANTLAAMKRTEEAMRAIKLGVDGVVMLEGERGEADEMAQDLLKRISA